MIKVVKKDGSLQDYKESKIAKACAGAGAPMPIAKAVAKIVSEKVKGKNKVKSSEIKAMVFAIFKQAGKVPSNWMKFKKKK
jgi:transcriptional regulator NrdR family protein